MLVTCLKCGSKMAEIGTSELRALSETSSCEKGAATVLSIEKKLQYAE